MLRFTSMATASGSGPNPAAPTALSDEQAEQFAASFTPSWDADGGEDADSSNGAANATLVDQPAVGAAQAAAVVQAAPATHAALSKQTLIGTAPQANAPTGNPSSEAIDPENILSSSTAPQPPVKAAAAPAAAPTTLKGTQPLQGAVPPQAQGKAPSRPPPAPAPAAKNARVAVNADPFAVSAGPRPRGAAAARQQSDDLDDFVPKKSSKTIYAVIGGLAIAAGLGLFLKFALTDDAPKPVEQHATGPAVTTAEIPPPPPKVDTPPPTTAATTATAAKADPTPPPATLPAPPTARAPEPPVAATHAAAAPQPRSEPRPRTPPPPHEAASPAPVTPKTAPKPANGSIVRDNPF
jgi:hypothetical protein